MAHLPLGHTRQALLARLAAHCTLDTREGSDGHVPPMVSAFVARERERITSFRPTTPGLAVVVEGSKHVEWGGRRWSCKAGDALCVPANAALDVVNEPDPATGYYRALYLQFPRAMMIEAARRWPEFSSRDREPRVSVVPPDETLTCAIAHAAEGLRGCSGRMRVHRLLGVVCRLAEVGHLRFTPKYAERSFVEAIRLLVRHRLDRPWPASEVAAAIGVSEATLRRRLGAEGRTLRNVLLSERMDAARLLLSERSADVAQAMAATGYVSRSHFSRNYRAAHGTVPSQSRPRDRNRPKRERSGR